METENETIAKNPFDEVSYKGRLYPIFTTILMGTVFFQPGKPGKPLAHDWDRHHVDLKWQAPESDGKNIFVLVVKLLLTF